MAVITPVTLTNPAFQILRNATAQANTGQTDWVNVPPWANYCLVYLNWTAKAGTTPLMDLDFLFADPVSRNDSNVIQVAEHAALTQLNDVAQVIYQIGPGVTGIADDTTQAASGDSWISLNAVLLPLMGFQLTLDRTTGNETYTYSLAIQFLR